MTTTEPTKQKAIGAYKVLSRSGRLVAASRVLFLLQRGSIRLGLNDADFEAELALEAAGLTGRFGRNFNNVLFTIH